MIPNLQSAHWVTTKKKAELISENNVLIEMEFLNKASSVKIKNDMYEILKDGFWCPRIQLMEKDKLVAEQKQIGWWGTKSEFEIEANTYTAKTKQGRLFNITYAFHDKDVLTYKLDADEGKPKITFEITSVDIPEKHLMLLLALGYYMIKNIAIEALANDFVISAVA